jgi:uncharacterized protein
MKLEVLTETENSSIEGERKQASDRPDCKMRFRTCVCALVLVISFVPLSVAQFRPTEEWRSESALPLETLQEKALAGDADAQNELGIRYYQGDGVPKDIDEAERWYRLAVKQNNVAAINNLGLLTSKEKGVEEYPVAAALYHKAALLGSAVGQYNLGLMYRYGYGVKRVYETAARWIKISANAGYAPAQIAIAHMYRRGMGVPRDMDKALKWYELAALQELPIAQFNLGKLYQIRYISSPTEENHHRAMMWLTAAAENGEVDAQGTLGIIYERGLGVSQNNAKAWTWLSIAAQNGSAKAKRKISVLEKKMTPNELHDAQEMKAELQERVYRER